MRCPITSCALAIGFLAVAIVLCFDSSAADPQCITRSEFQSLKERSEELAPHVDTSRVYSDYVVSSRLLRDRLARVSECQQEATYLDNVLNSCRPQILEYNSQVEVHNEIQRRLETAKILKPNYLEMKRLMALPRCAQ